MDTSTIEELFASLKYKRYHFYFPAWKVIQGLMAAHNYQRQGWQNSQMSNKAKMAKIPLVQYDMW